MNFILFIRVLAVVLVLLTVLSYLGNMVRNVELGYDLWRVHPVLVWATFVLVIAAFTL